MSWLIPFLTGFANGFVQELTRPQPAGGTYSPAGYDFRQHMAALAEAVGVHLSSLHERRASFSFAVHGEPFMATAVLSGDHIYLFVYSKVEFPPGRIPADLVQAVKNLNAQLHRYELDVMDGDHCSAFYVLGRVSPGDLTPQVLRGELLQMAAGISKLDAWMAQYGYAR